MARGIPTAQSLASAETLWRLTAALRAYHRPLFLGLERIDATRPSLLVGNHTIYGLLDIPHLTAAIYRERGVLVRGLADHMHFRVPGWGEFLERFGAVVGTRENCAGLMEDGEHLLVFPGGAREVFKRKREAYRLIWKERTGFARMAIAHGYPITPFASVGAEECYDILVDADDVMASPLGRFLEGSGIADAFLRAGESIPPIARGLGLTMLPRPERFYFSIAEAIETTPFAGREDDPEALRALRAQVQSAVETEISRLLEFREQDPKRNLLRSLMPSKK